MNLLDAYVTKIISHKPYFQYDKWWVMVEYECWGLNSRTALMFNDEEDAKNVQIGHQFYT